MEYDNYIFDLYGTLIDVRTDEYCDETWEKWCKVLDEKGIKHPMIEEFRKDFFEADKALRKKQLEEGPFEVPEIDITEVYEDLFRRYGNGTVEKDIIDSVSYDFRVASREYVRLFPDVENFLKRLRECGKHVYILSNAQATYTLPEIKMFGLHELTDDFLMSSDYGCMKPDRKFFDFLLERYDMDRSKTVMIGDSESSDVKGAKASKLHYIHLVNDNDPNKFYTANLPLLRNL